VKRSSDLDLSRRVLIERAAAPYRRVSRFAWHFARGKLAGDPIFFSLLARGLIPEGYRVLDLGCGQGLLPAWVLAARESFERGEWPADWPPPPRLGSYCGIELAAADLGRAQAALGKTLQFEEGDIRDSDFGCPDLVVIMDVLHYLSPADQETVLRKVHAALPAGGLFLTRVGDAAAGLPFLLSKWVDYVVAFLRWGRVAPLHCRPLADWQYLLCRCGFSVDTLPMNGKRPFANLLLIARRGA
jgi:SAM-dependent methyltransferase